MGPGGEGEGGAVLQGCGGIVRGARHRGFYERVGGLVGWFGIVPT